MMNDVLQGKCYFNLTESSIEAPKMYSYKENIEYTILCIRDCQKFKA